MNRKLGTVPRVDAGTRGESKDGTLDWLGRRFHDLVARKGFEMRRFIISLAALILVLASQNTSGQIQYTVTDLGTLPDGNYSLALGINDRGQVVGVP